ncbi:B12-binding domain-containing radical SAM protein [Mycobacteroides abscessus]|uniref:B12-binding domain-containing radical SAM protein n=1 Tax=Mycobacteroides abscessus TaxID=36809 RepID=UPI0009A76AE4|nr:radical SAM protein [Mycobacteroides abscessus]SKI12421.1 methyltransferase [Mycobacteroides abscessus subsp. massiliense]SKM21193.1 methyltransferase [Mycobacteroides abscessus subsp. massiliense]
MAASQHPVLGLAPGESADIVFVNAPLRDYDLRPRTNDFTLPVLGMAYIATYARAQGFTAGVLDAEAHGLPLRAAAELVNAHTPRWVGLNLLAPTYEMSAQLAALLSPTIDILVGGHHARALPERILRDPRMQRCQALVIGEAELRVSELLRDTSRRADLPQVLWLDDNGALCSGSARGTATSGWLAPDIDTLPFVDRSLLSNDPVPTNGRLRASMVGARGCPYNCSFCGAAVSANPDVTIRVRSASNIVAELEQLRDQGITAFRFVDDLFLGARRVITDMVAGFQDAGIGDWATWDATGRINVIDRLTDEELAALHRQGLREVAVGIESASPRLLSLIDKRIDPDMTRRVITRLLQHGISVKGYFIFGFPTETSAEIADTHRLIEELWELSDRLGGDFRASAFEYRPYPGTPDWTRLIATGNYTTEELLDYQPVDLTDGGINESMYDRDEFNFAVNRDLAAAPRFDIRAALQSVVAEQHRRTPRSTGVRPA